MNSVLTVLVVLFVVQVWFLIVNALAQSKIRQISESTHQIVNSQRSAMQTAIWLLSKRIAEENPEDKMAQDAADRASRDLEMLDKPRRAAI